MTGISDLERLIERMEAAATSLRELISEANSTIKDGRAVVKEILAAKAVVDNYATRAIQREFDRAIADGMRQYRDVLQENIDTAAADVTDMFERHANRCLYGNEAGRGESVFDLMRTALITQDLNAARAILKSQNHAMTKEAMEKRRKGR